MRIRIQSRLHRVLCFLVALAVCTGCATTPPGPNVWRDPNFAGPPFKKVFVIGLSSQDLTDRRGFEDQMVAKLGAAGVQAVPGYRYLSQHRPADQAGMYAAVAQAGADAVLLARFLGFATQDALNAAIVPGYVTGGPAAGGDIAPGTGMYGSYAGWYAVPVDTQYQVATIYTTLFDGRTQNTVWTYNPQTFDPANLRQQTDAYTTEVVGLLRASGLVSAPWPLQ